VLFSGDNILRTVTTWLGPPESDLNAYRASMEYINSLEPLALILGAHGGPVRRARERIMEIVDLREKRTGQVLEIVRKSGGHGITAEEIIRELYPRDGRIKWEIARGWVVLTLKELEKQGFLSRETGRGSFRFSIAGRSAADRGRMSLGEKS
jgi:glyoxylase-like metal-dependent hydrolase (beta-lactamase superfamily II)